MLSSYYSFLSRHQWKVQLSKGHIDQLEDFHKWLVNGNVNIDATWRIFAKFYKY